MAARPAPHRTKRELHNALSHIAYEAEALSRAATHFTNRSRHFDLEAALLHARNLTEFFWAPSARHPPHNDGVYAVHYVPQHRLKALRGSFPQRPNQHYVPLCAQLSHISVRRSRRDLTVDFSRLVGPLALDLNAVWCIFQREVQG